MSTDSWDRSFSWSKMSLYNTCPRQFKYKYVDELEEDEPESMARRDGINFHEYMEQYYEELENPEDGPTEEHAVQVAMDMFEPQNQARYRQALQDWHAWNQHLYETWGKEHWTPTYTEKWIEAVTQDSTEIDALTPDETHHGYVDRIQWNPNRESYGIIDYKSKAKDGSSIKGQIAYYGEILLELEEILDAPVDWGGCYGYKTGSFKMWDIHWASTKATKKKIVSLRELKEGYEPNFGYHCDWCPYKEECSIQEAENEGLLGM